MERPKVVLLCGSSRFIGIMSVCGWLLERDEGCIALGLHYLPPWYKGAAHHQAEADGVKEKMDQLHICKVDMADEIFVVDYGKYVGESTKELLRYANEAGKKIRYFSTDPVREIVLDRLNS